MKKQAAIFLSVFLIFALSGCSRTQTAPSAASLYDRGLEVISLMAEMAGSEEYMGVMTGNSEITRMVQKMAQGDYSRPERVYALSAAEEGSFSSGLEWTSLSENLQQLLRNREISSLTSSVNGMDGAECLAAANTCSAQITFVSDSVKEPVLYLYLFQDGAPAGVAFMPGNDGTAAASGTFILADELAWDSAEAVAAYFKNLGLQVNVSEVTLED